MGTLLFSGDGTIGPGAGPPASEKQGGRIMGAILGLGVTHYPPLCGRDEDMARILKRVLQDPGLPEQYRQPAGWPAAMAEEDGAAAKSLVTGLLEKGFDVSYAYRPLHHPLGHAFMNTLLYLDYDRQGFPYPVVPFSINCYGRRVISQYGGVSSFADLPSDAQLDPPSPSPARCFDLGRAAAQVLATSPLRVALVASSSWSHAFLTPKHHLLYPDVEADRALYDKLRVGDYEAWRGTPLTALEESGQQEMLNWMCLAGAMSELGRKPDATTF